MRVLILLALLLQLASCRGCLSDKGCPIDPPCNTGVCRGSAP